MLGDEEVGGLWLVDVPELEIKTVARVPSQSGGCGSIKRGRDIVTTALVGDW